MRDLTPDELRAAIERAELLSARDVARELAPDDADEDTVTRIWERLRKRRRLGVGAPIPDPVVDARGPQWTRAQVEQMRREGVGEDSRRRKKADDN